MKGLNKFSLMLITLIALFMLTGCGKLYNTQSTKMADDTSLHEDFRKFNKQRWRIGSGKEWNLTSYGLRLYTVYFETAIIWYRKPMVSDVDMTIRFEHVGGGHPTITSYEPQVLRLFDLSYETVEDEIKTYTAGWIHKYRKGVAFFFVPGDSEETRYSPYVLRMIINAARWMGQKNNIKRIE